MNSTDSEAGFSSFDALCKISVTIFALISGFTVFQLEYLVFEMRAALFSELVISSYKGTTLKTFESAATGTSLLPMYSWNPTTLSGDISLSSINPVAWTPAPGRVYNIPGLDRALVQLP